MSSLLLEWSLGRGWGLEASPRVNRLLQRATTNCVDLSVLLRLGLKVFVIVVSHSHSCQLSQCLHEILNSAEDRVVYVEPPWRFGGEGEGFRSSQ